MDAIDLFLFVERIAPTTLPDLLEDLSPWERGQILERLRLIIQELEKLPTSTYNDDGTFTRNRPDR